MTIGALEAQHIGFLAAHGQLRGRGGPTAAGAPHDGSPPVGDGSETPSTVIRSSRRCVVIASGCFAAWALLSPLLAEAAAAAAAATGGGSSPVAIGRPLCRRRVRCSMGVVRCDAVGMRVFIALVCCIMWRCIYRDVVVMSVCIALMGAPLCR